MHLISPRLPSRLTSLFHPRRGAVSSSSILAAAIGVVLPLTFIPLGCAPADSRTDIDRSIAAYDNREYAEALKLAEGASENATTTKDAHEASYMAGMSAFQLDDFASAERWLTDAARSGDRKTAGDAGVMLGNAQLKLNKPADAARSFAAAATNLDGANATKARIASANAYRESGNSRAADEQFRLGNVPTTVTVDAPTKAPAAARTPSHATKPAVVATAPNGAFVLQAGAFRDETKAKKRADELRAKSMSAGLGAPRVSSKKGADGSTLWVVQIGGFVDRRSADSAVAKLGASGVVVGRAVAAS
ncbi:MAG: SPOR domain-containing protein [Phycisphaerae bacterium]|nr:SPOR domain-containing protein [Phycisphaerae bacterium]